ncbi:MAG: hypothetical protein VCG02_19820 [Verrucomicrobiota bacterium]
MGLISSEHREVAAWAGIKTCYAMDVDGGIVTLLRARRTGHGLDSRIVFAGDPSADTEGWENALNDMRAEVARDPAWIASVVPAHSALVKTVDAPFASQAKAAKVFPSLLDIRLPFPLEQCHYAFPEMHALPDGQVRALAVAARFDEIDAQIDTCKVAGVEPSLLDHEGLALWSFGQSVSKGCRVVAWLGHERSCLSLGQDGELEQVHGLRIGVRAVDAKGLDELVRRIQRIWKTLPEAWSETTVNWILSGELSESMATELETELNAFSRAEVTREEPFLLEQVATRALKPGPLRCNFLADAPTLQAGLVRRNRKTAAFFAACGLLLCALALTWTQMVGARERNLQARIDETFKALTHMPNQQRGMEPVIAQRVLKDQAKDLQPFTGMFAPSQATRLNGLLQFCATQGVRLQKFSLTPDQIHCKGRAESMDECIALKQLLEQDYVVELVHEPAAPYVDFTLNGQLRL